MHPFNYQLLITLLGVLLERFFKRGLQPWLNTHSANTTTKSRQRNDHNNTQQGRYGRTQQHNAANKEFEPKTLQQVEIQGRKKV